MHYLFWKTKTNLVQLVHDHITTEKQILSLAWNGYQDTNPVLLTQISPVEVREQLKKKIVIKIFKNIKNKN